MSFSGIQASLVRTVYGELANEVNSWDCVPNNMPWDKREQLERTLRWKKYITLMHAQLFVRIMGILRMELKVPYLYNYIFLTLLFSVRIATIMKSVLIIGVNFTTPRRCGENAK